MRVVFLVHPKAASLGSSVLRGEQLAALMRRALPQDWTVEVRRDLGFSEAFVFVTKGALARFSIDDLLAVGEANPVVVGDFVDAPVKPEVLLALDALVACSHRQRAHYGSAHPELPTFFVTHCPDIRLEPVEPPQDAFRLGYFGETVNARFAIELADRLDVVHIDTAVQDFSWARRLPRYNAHYALRSHEKSSRMKPFVKGFTAALCGSPALVERTESDAEIYLPSDYPFFVEGGALDDARRAIDEMREAFGGPDWRYAVEAMAEVCAASSPARCVEEMCEMLRETLGLASQPNVARA